MPDVLLKAVQRRIADRLLCMEEISSYAAAYRPGGSIMRNAAPHLGHLDVLKLYIRKDFDNVTYPLIKEKAFPAFRYSEPNRILLAILCTYNDALPQGAPTSPAISNIILKGFDYTVGEWCRKRKITYTRYCDDMSFSGKIGPAEKKEVTAFVEQELRKTGHLINAKKTVLVHAGQRKVRDRHRGERKAERSPCHPQKKPAGDVLYKLVRPLFPYAACRDPHGPEKYIRSLLGRIAFVLSVDPEDEEMLGYRRILTEMRKEYET